MLNKKDIKNPDLILKYNIIYKLIPIVGVIASIVFPLLMLDQESKNIQSYNEIDYVLVVLLFLFLSLPLFIEFFFIDITVIGENMICKSPWRKNRIINFNEIISIKYSPICQWHKIITKDQGVLRVHGYLLASQQLLILINDKTGIKSEQKH